MSLPPEVVEQVDLARSAYIQIDMQRRHLDPAVGYHLVNPTTAQALVTAAHSALNAARTASIPVVHVIAYSRRPSPWGFVDVRNPFWAYQTGKIIPGLGRPRQSGKNVEGSAYSEIMPELAPERDEPVVVKRRYSAFYGTDLETILRGFGAETLFLCGVNTNSCVLATVFDAFSRDFRVIVLADACGSLNGDEYHRFALLDIEAALGHTITTRDFCELMDDKRTQVPA